MHFESEQIRFMEGSSEKKKIKIETVEKVKKKRKKGN